MILKQSIFDLIKSLSGSEKRYIKLSPEFRADNNHTRLFDCYERMRTNNDGVIQKEFKGEAILNQVHVAENYLYKAILKCLRNFHADSSIEFEIKNHLNDVEILYRKGLYQQCRSTLNHIEKIALKFENHFALIEVYNWYGELRQVMAHNKSFPNHIELYQNEVNSINAHKNTVEYKKLSSDLFFTMRSEGMSRDKEQLREIEKIIFSSLLQSEAKALTFRSKLSFYQLHGAYQTLKGNLESAITFQQKVVALLEANPHQVQRKPLFYLISMNNLAIGLTKTKQYAEAIQAIQKLRDSTKVFGIKNSTDWQTKLFTISFSLKLDVYIKSDDVKKGIELIPVIQSELERLKNQVNPIHELQFSFAFARLLFTNKKYKESLRWVNKLLNNPNKELRADIYCCARMLQIIIYYETKDWETISYAIINTTRYLKSSKKLYRAETALLATMRKLEDVEKTKELLQLKKLNSAFETIFNDSLEINLLDNFNFQEWVSDKIKLQEED
ncbi:hypothetical protein BH10BAC1_BH10BAC1_01630 [soil metagenome]